MLLHKHGFVRKITAFSLVLFVLFMDPGFIPGSSVFAASVSELHAKLQMLEEEEKELHSALAETGQAERFWLEERLRRLCAGGSETPVSALLEVSAAKAYTEEECLARLEQLKEEKHQVEEALALWRQEWDAAVEAASFNAGGRMVAFIWPVPGFTAVTCDFGDGHRGIDIAGPGIDGSPILAAESGRVTYSGWMESYGYCVFLEHGEGFSTRYAHAKAVACTVGDVVAKGDVIAYTGSTGYSTGPHLHFEVIRNGELQVPARFLKNVTE